MKKITIKTKGEKMRKFILPLLVAGAVAFTAAQAMATSATRTASFEENHAYQNSYVGGTVTTIENTTTPGNHYKKTDMLEQGRHGGGSGGYQISSSILKSVAMDSIPGWEAADGSVGYTTNANPFQAGLVGITDYPLMAPRYTQPCPDWFGPKGTCPANAYAVDPQTEPGSGNDAIAWDGIVLDDLYQAVGADDSKTDTVSGGSIANRTFDQWLDQLFLNGNAQGHNMTVMAGTTDVTTYGRHFNIADTLDQDIADWSTSYHGTVGQSAKDETTGIYGKLTMIFQLAGRVTGTQACASGAGFTEGGAHRPGGNVQCDYAQADDTLTGAHLGEGVGSFAARADGMTAWKLDQWVVSDVWDWVHKADGALVADPHAVDKNGGEGVAQGYSSWFNDGAGQKFDYIYNYDGSHGTIDKTFTKGDHTHPDP
ncbi:MAG: hypothetical protein HZA08_04415 [Nitrospirae bacterium]|nr:hypothetical protein [Nitrospirota bacterium]